MTAIRMSTARILVIGLAGLWLAGCQDPAEKLTSPDSSACVEGLRALGKRGHEADIERVAEATHHQDEMVAAEAVRTLGIYRRPASVQVLRKVAAGETRAAVREEAVLQLGRQSQTQSADMLRQVVRTDPDPRVRAAAATSLARLKSYDDIDVLMTVAETDPDLMVQSTAVGAVERMIGLKFGYDSRATAAERIKALERMRSIALTAAATLKQRDAARRSKGS